MPERAKIEFHLTQDEDGYPGFESEWMWAIALDGNEYRIDNIPFFVHDVSLGDCVSAIDNGDNLVFQNVVRKGGHTTLRAIFDPLTPTQGVRERLIELGCSVEGGHTRLLISIDVPPDADYSEIVAYLDALLAASVLEYETACVQHAIADA